MIYISNLEDMPRHVETLRPSHLVSLVEPARQPPTPPGVAAGLHLRIQVHDLSAPLPGYLVPERHDVDALVRFVEGWSGAAPLLVHCVAGISRSTAAALIALAVKTPASEPELIRRLSQAAPHAQPNRRLVALADRVLARDGRLIAAREAMAPAIEVTEGPLVTLALAAA